MDSSKKNPELEIYTKFADTYNRLGDYESALQFYHKALNLNISNRMNEAGIVAKIGMIHAKQSNNPAAEKCYRKALQIYEQHRSQIDIATISNNLGIIYQNTGEYSSALKYCLKAQNIYKDLDNRTGISSAMANLASIFLHLNEVEKALSYYLEALKLQEELEDRKGISKILNNIGVIYFRKNDLKKAGFYFHQSLANNEKTGDKYAIASALNNLGDLQTAQKNYREAMQYFKRALKIDREIGNKAGMCVCLKNIGYLKIEHFDDESGRGDLLKSLEIAVSISALDLEAEIEELLAEVLRAKGELEKAENHKSRSRVLKEKISQRENKQNTLQQRKEFEEEKSRIDTLLFQKQNAELTAANEKLKQEITERKRIEKHLQISEERFRLLFRNAAEFIFVLNQEFDIMDLNPEVIKKSGYTRKELLSGSFFDLYSYNSRILLKKFFYSEDHDKNDRLELEFHCKSGEKLVLDCVFSKLKNFLDDSFSVVSFQRDITKQKEIEQMKSEFVSLVAHELRSPLASIKAFTSTIIADQEMEEAVRNQFLQTIDSETDRLSSLIENLLDVSKIEKGFIKMNLIENNLNEIIELAIANLNPLAEEKNIAVTAEFPEHAPILRFDSEQILRVVMNLLSNAIKYSAAESKVNISSFERKREMLVKVSDKGRGIAENYLHRVFDKFYRVDDSEENVKGTGLGLSIAREIIRSHQGEMWVESELGKGSDFFFTLPLELRE